MQRITKRVTKRVETQRNAARRILPAAAGLVAALVLQVALAAGISKEQAIEQALLAHPGAVEKAYEETKRGVEVWEVKINGDDGNEWKSYYRVDDGALFMRKLND